MATNAISDGEITPELNEKAESASSSSTKEDSNIVVGDSLFHLLDGRWTFWYTHRPTTFRNSSANYDSCLKKLGSFFPSRILSLRIDRFQVHSVRSKNSGATMIT